MLHVESFRDYCLSKRGVTEEFPFGEDTLVFKVMGKIFAITGLDAEQFSINLKCAPERAETLREMHAAVQPGYHMNKKHWNTVIVDGTIPDKELKGMIDHSYDLVVQSLPKKIRTDLFS